MQNKWGFLKNIINIKTFFSSGALAQDPTGKQVSANKITKALIGKNPAVADSSSDDDDDKKYGNKIKDNKVNLPKSAKPISSADTCPAGCVKDVCPAGCQPIKQHSKRKHHHKHKRAQTSANSTQATNQTTTGNQTNNVEKSLSKSQPNKTSNVSHTTI